MNAVKQKCIVTDRGAGFSEGVGFTTAASGSDKTGSGGPAVKTKAVSSGGTAFMKGQAGRRNPTEVHHNGGTMSIKGGSTNPPR